MTYKEIASQLTGFKKIQQPLPHMVVVVFENGEILQSYNTIIAVWTNDHWYFDKQVHQDPDLMTRTTMKHTTQWCGMDLQKRIKLANDPNTPNVSWYND